ncbi:M50 family metallopeptidase [Salinarimonas sp. NSM]|uniref:M50 family metallopeptidase n=1 Tax=Salinarimonas sp. NSM TaxID=3458003 RepID=UPI0040355B38
MNTKFDTDAEEPDFYDGDDRELVEPFKRADQIVADLLLEEALPPGTVERLGGTDPLCILIAPPGPGWTTSVKAALRRRLAAANDISWFVREPSDRVSKTDAVHVAETLADGRSLIAIAPTPEILLPRLIVASADLRLDLGRVEARHLEAAIAAVTGEETLRLTFGGAALSPEEVSAAIRQGSSASACVDRLRRAQEATSRARADVPPRLEQLGLGAEARAWAEQLVREASRVARGEIGLAALPRGALLAGPPGTGKTLLAQSIAAEASLPITATSIGEWMAPGHLGACITAMQTSFAAAQARVPSILFVDETDGLVDPRRDLDNWFQAFRSALLAAIDGATTSPGLILIGACNHEDLVDGALKRPGRMDRVIRIEPPDAEGLAVVLRTHLDADLPQADLRPLARLAIGSTGADIARAVRDARAHARDCARPLRIEDLSAALLPRDDRDPATLLTVALHEAGHAIAAIAVGQRLEAVSIVGDAVTGGRATIGMAQIVSRDAVERAVLVLLAGRAADVAFGGVPLGNAASDLEGATQLLTEAHARMGLGASLLAVPDARQSLLLDPTLRASVERDLARLWAVARDVIDQERAAVEALARALLRKRVVSGDEARRLFQRVRRQSDRASRKASGSVRTPMPKR